jgi:hypothetical protein
VTYIAGPNHLDGLSVKSKSFGVDQPRTRTAVVAMWSRIDPAVYGLTAKAIVAASLVIPSGCTEPEDHFGEDSVYGADFCDADHNRLVVDHFYPGGCSPVAIGDGMSKANREPKSSAATSDGGSAEGRRLPVFS